MHPCVNESRLSIAQKLKPFDEAEAEGVTAFCLVFMQVEIREKNESPLSA